jgi:hydroxymethylbilane synthase
MANLPVLRLGTRGSLLARTQSQIVADALARQHPNLRVELRVFKTSGDQITERPLHEFGGKGLFTKELEQALLDGQVDFAVHSFKDVPVTMPLVDQSNLIVAAVPTREDPRDALVSTKPTTLADLPARAKVGTGSLRRRCQILAMRPDLVVEPIRGNIDTRLRKLREGQYDAVVLAAAGLTRAKLFDARVMSVISSVTLLAAPGQGALALQCRRDDQTTRGLLAVLHDPRTAACVAAERALVAALRGDCHSPIAAVATLEADGRLYLRAAVGARDGTPPVLRGEAIGDSDQPQSVVDDVFRSLAAQGVEALLAGHR